MIRPAQTFVFVALGSLISLWIFRGAEPAQATCPTEAQGSPKSARADPASQPADDDVSALIQQLSAEDWRVRERAMKGLEKTGEAARPSLNRLMASPPNPETARGALELLKNLDEASKYGPTLVSLHLHDALPKDALNALATQAGIKIAFETDVLPAETSGLLLTLDVDRQPMWSALEKICAEAKLRVVESSPNHPIRLVRADPMEPPAPYAVAGPFLVEIKSIYSSSGVTLGVPPDFVATRIEVCIRAEPKLAACTFDVVSLDDLEMEDGRQFDQQLLRWGSHHVNRPNEISVQLRSQLSAKKINRLRMTGRFTLEEKLERIEVEDLLNVRRTERLINGYRVALIECKGSEDGRFALKIEAGPGIHTFEEFDVFREVLSSGPSGPRLIDAEGKTLTRSGGTSGSGPGSYMSTCKFTQTTTGQRGEPVKAVWDVPSETRTLNFPIEFVDLPLPPP